MTRISYKRSFTLVELMIVIAILAILSAIVLFTLNPSRLFNNFRDTRRVNDITTINKAIIFMEGWNTNGINYGISTNVYISLPDTSSTCSSYALPTLPTGYSYACKPTSTYKNSDSTGWIPIDFTVSNNNRYISILPVDPTNDITYFYSYFPGGSYELRAKLASRTNTNATNDDGYYDDMIESGSPNRTFTTPVFNNFLENSDISSGLTNWNGFTELSSTDYHSSPYSLKYTGVSGSYMIIQNKFIPYNPNKQYKITGWLKSIGVGGLSKLYYCLRAYDEDKLEIAPTMSSHRANTETYLREALNPGDSTIKLASSANWYVPVDTPSKYQLCVNLYNYKNYTGYTYTRSNLCEGTNGYYTSISNNDLMLYQPYNGVLVPAGTLVAQPATWGVLVLVN